MSLIFNLVLISYIIPQLHTVKLIGKIRNISFFHIISSLLDSCLILNDTSLLKDAMVAVDGANIALKYLELHINIKKTYTEAELWNKKYLGKNITHHTPL